MQAKSYSNFVKSNEDKTDGIQLPNTSLESVYNDEAVKARRQRWEQEEAENTKKFNLHYQDVLYQGISHTLELGTELFRLLLNPTLYTPWPIFRIIFSDSFFLFLIIHIITVIPEARQHGVGFYSFSKDEEERARQMQELEKIRKETESVRAQSAQTSGLKKAALNQRLMKVRQRKRQKLGLPPLGNDHLNSKYVFK